MIFLFIYEYGVSKNSSKSVALLLGIAQICFSGHGIAPRWMLRMHWRHIEFGKSVRGSHGVAAIVSFVFNHLAAHQGLTGHVGNSIIVFVAATSHVRYSPRSHANDSGWRNISFLHILYLQ